MDPAGTSRFRAGVVARSRFTEDLLVDQAARGLTQYVILGAGLDTLTQRNPGLASMLHIFEVDQPGPQTWKRERLTELGYGIPPGLHLIPVDFEADQSWWDRLVAAGFSPARSAVVASLGVSMYLTKEANAATLSQVASLAPGSSLVMSFAPPLAQLDRRDRAARLLAEQGAQASGTPWLSSFAPQELLTLARRAGFKHARHITAAMLNERYFAKRRDRLRTSPGEELLFATT
jgi:methyltransferase (TIGR00027 family)